MRIAAVCFLSLLSITLAAGCGDERSAPINRIKTPGDGPTAAPLLLIGIDGLEWDVLLPLLADGKLPTLARLMDAGIYGTLDTIQPTLSPVIWTSIATGKTPAEHGIRDFARRDPSGKLTLFTNADRKTKTLWNILSDYRKRVAVVGWWITWPVDEINGVMVAQTNTSTDLSKPWKGQLVRGVPAQVFPAGRQDEMLAVLDAVDAELPALTERIFGRRTHKLSPGDAILWDNTQWAFRADATYHRITLSLLKEQPPIDVLLFYFGGTDVVGHRFWRHRQPDLYTHKPSADEIENMSRVIPDYYVYADQMLGEVLAAAPPNANVLVVSDHGMKPVNRNKRFTPGLFSAHHLDGPPGAFFAAGPMIRDAELPGAERVRLEDVKSLGSVMDIAPTILAAMRIPLGTDMKGRVLAELFRLEFSIERQPPPVATHDTPEFRASRPRPPGADPREAERIRQLKGLGYLGGDTPEDPDPGEP